MKNIPFKYLERVHNVIKMNCQNRASDSPSQSSHV